MLKIYKLENTIKAYDWGSKSEISKILGREPAKDPIAELWLGAHPASPSIIKVNNKNYKLNQWISEDPVIRLGEKANKEFEGQLPFLLKILSAAKPLSIQAHPNKNQAIEGFERENQQNIPLDAFERTYKDPNHKPELICALNDFEALNGFRPWKDIRRDFLQLEHKGLEKIIKSQDLNPPEIAIKELFIALMSLDDGKKQKWADHLYQWAQKNMTFKLSQLIIDSYDFFPGDIGLFAILMLNYIKLKPGEAMFLNSNQFHAYLKGTGIELMANSDNVLRGGLTKKYINIPELSKIIEFNPYSPVIQKTNPEGEFTFYESHAKEFQLARIDLNGEVDHSFENGEILLSVRGRAVIKNKDNNIEVNQGESVYLSPETQKITLLGKALIFIARMNPIYLA